MHDHHEGVPAAHGPRRSAAPEWSVPGVGEATVFRGVEAGEAVPAFAIEIAHGATLGEHFDAVQAKLRVPIPTELKDFFFVNTDVGAPELAEALARAICRARPTAAVVVLRCLVPRTFVDTNRKLDAGDAAWREGKVTPGMGPWIRDDHDRAFLHALHHRYQELADRVISAVCGAGGRALLLHTYAPRSVDVAVDEHIVASLHHAYTPEVFPTWPLRPEVDVIGKDLDGLRIVPEPMLRALHTAFAARGVGVADGETYPLHPSTCAWHHVHAHLGRVLCVEVRRDLLARPFVPFVELAVDPHAAEHLAQGFVEGWAFAPLPAG